MQLLAPAPRALSASLQYLQGRLSPPEGAGARCCTELGVFRLAGRHPGGTQLCDEASPVYKAVFQCRRCCALVGGSGLEPALQRSHRQESSIAVEPRKSLEA